MMKKTNRLAVVFMLTESITRCCGSTIEPSDMEEQNAKIAVASLIDSLETRKPTRSFKLSLMAIQKNQHKLKSFSKNQAEQDFFTAISDVLTVNPIKDDSINTILKVAQDGYKQARTVVKMVLGKKINFKTNDWMSIARENLKIQIRQLIEHSSSEEETSLSDTSLEEEFFDKKSVTTLNSKISDNYEDKREMLSTSKIQLQKSIDAINKTLKFILNPNALEGIEDLPEQNKKILLDLVTTYVEEGQKKLIPLLNALTKYVKFDDTQSPFDSSAQIINWGFQVGQNYEQYTRPGNFKYLQSLVDCFIYSYGEKILQKEPVIPVDNIRIIARTAIEQATNNCSHDLLALLKKFSASTEF